MKKSKCCDKTCVSGSQGTGVKPVNKPRKRLVRQKPEALTVPMEISQAWSMDVMRDQLQDGR
jgi:hypothetical protein